MTDKPKIFEPINAANSSKQSGDLQQTEEMPLEKMADLFIQVANDLVVTQNIGQVGRAMRLATSMFNSHEYALKSPDMEVDRGDITEWFINEYRSMLDYHMDMHKAMKKNESSGC